MPGPANSNAEGKGGVIRRETFADGSELLEFENGSLMIVESKLAKTTLGREQTVNYGVHASDNLEFNGD